MTSSRRVVFMAWTGGGSAAVVAAGLTTGLTGFSFVSIRTGTVFTLTAVGAWSGHQRALKLRASKGMMWTPSLTTGAGGAVSRLRGHVRCGIAAYRDLDDVLGLSATS